MMQRYDFSLSLSTFFRVFCVFYAIQQCLVALDALEGLLGCILVAFFLAVAVAGATGNAFDEKGGMENGGVAFSAFARLFLAENEAVLILLTPLYQDALEVDFLFLHALDVDVLLEDLLFEKTAAVLVASVEVDGPDKCLEGISVHETVVARGDCTDMVYEFVKSEADGYLVERTSADYLAPQHGEEPFLLVAIVSVEYVGHNGSQHRIAQKLKSFVADLAGRNFVLFACFLALLALFPLFAWSAFFPLHLLLVASHRLVHQSQFV